MSYTEMMPLQNHLTTFSELDFEVTSPWCQPEISVRQTTPENRSQASHLIRDQFKQRFGATLAPEMADIYHGIDRSGECIAAFVANKSPEEFFVRHYIGDVVKTLRQKFGPGVNENNVVELGHLSAAKCQVLKNLAPAIAECFYSEGYRYLICTATRSLRVFFARKHLAPIILGPASESQLPESQQGIWGQYYNHKPTVIAGDLDVALEQFHHGNG